MHLVKFEFQINSRELCSVSYEITGTAIPGLGFPDGSMVRIQLPMQETWVQSLGQEDPLEKGMATHSSLLAWRIPRTEDPGGLQSMGSQRVRYDWATNTHNSIKGLKTWLCVSFSVEPGPCPKAAPLLSLHSIFSLPGLATVQICPLELREGHGSWSQETGSERLPSPRAPQGPAQFR